VLGIDARCVGCERRFSLSLLDFSIAISTAEYSSQGRGRRPSGFFSCICFLLFSLFYARSLCVDLFMYAFCFLCSYNVGNAFSSMNGDF
jgi:hypothetical protein